MKKINYLDPSIERENLTDKNFQLLKNSKFLFRLRLK